MKQYYHGLRSANRPVSRVQERAAEGITLTTPPEEVSAAATVIQLQPFVHATLLAAAQQEEEEGEEKAEQGAGKPARCWAVGGGCRDLLRGC